MNFTQSNIFKEVIHHKSSYLSYFPGSLAYETYKQYRSEKINRTKSLQYALGTELCRDIFTFSPFYIFTVSQAAKKPSNQEYFVIEAGITVLLTVLFNWFFTKISSYTASRRLSSLNLEQIVKE